MATMASKVLLPSHSQPFHENFSILSSFMKWSTTQKPMPSQEEEEDNQSTASQNRVAVESSEKKELSAALGNPKPKLKIKFRIKKESKADDHAAQVQTQTLVTSDGVYSSNQIKPWNLRSSRKDQDHTSASAPVQAQLPSQESAQLGLGLGFDAEKKTMEKRKRSCFLIALTKEEIEADILAITGSKSMARPKKRPKNVQRRLDNLFPGLCLKSITPNSYKVRDAV
ncbi:hypothetical protein LWI28_009721 [Acer negundo]|uniref:Uncharacterized protein n=1 Tax=Acer negundo TaxID=4023 RepID=A0AAD5IZB2_ACENE|nr:hypothetical protein LWI28_009721 [Acer negundo]KAK4849175.1 hypothetical protein QYF36_021761 [Acer negundo]